MIPSLPKKANTRIPHGRATLGMLLAFGSGILTMALVGIVLFRFYVPATPVTQPSSIEKAPQIQLPDDQPDTAVEEDASALAVDWLDTPTRIDAQTLGFALPEPSGYALDDAEQLNQIYQVHHVGTITSAPFGGRALYLIHRACEGTCAGVHYRVIDDRGERGLMLLRQYSNDLFEEDEPYFFRTNEYTIKEFAAPDSITLTREEKQFQIEAEPFSPAVLARDYRPDPDATYLEHLEHEIFGTVVEHVEAGLFYVTMPDLSLKIYRAEDPLFLASESHDPLELIVNRIFFSEIPESLPHKEENSIFDTYSPNTPGVSGPPRSYDIVDDLTGRVIPIDIDETSEEQLYVLASWEDPMYREVFDELLHRPNLPEYEDFLESNPLLFWRNRLGRWVRLRRTFYYPNSETKCGYINSAL